MKKIATRLLYVFSFALLFTALYLNFVQSDEQARSFSSVEKKAVFSSSLVSKNSAVAQPENNTNLK